jgi:hypothetical protein
MDQRAGNPPHPSGAGRRRNLPPASAVDEIEQVGSRPRMRSRCSPARRTRDRCQHRGGRPRTRPDPLVVQRIGVASSRPSPRGAVPGVTMPE